MGKAVTLKEVDEELADNLQDDKETTDIPQQVNKSVDLSLIFSPVSVQLECQTVIETATISKLCSIRSATYSLIPQPLCIQGFQMARPAIGHLKSLWYLCECFRLSL